MRIALFDYHVTPNNPAGSCSRQLLRGLCEEFEFTVFSVSFDNPAPDRIRWVRIPAPARPLALLFLIYHALAPLYFARHVRRHGRFDLVQYVESNLSFGDICYAHFCHRAFLRHDWQYARFNGLRAWFRWLDYWLHAQVEPIALSRARGIVAPSQGLTERFQRTYPALPTPISVISNPVDIQHLHRPHEFDAATFRSRLGLPSNALTLVFIALGNFEHKGLPQILESLQSLPDVHLIVVGGTSDLVNSYRHRILKSGLENRVKLAGFQPDVRPFLWSSDAFILPSVYETFPLVALEAAAAGLPIISTPVHGVREFLVEGKNGFYIDRTAKSIHLVLERLLAQEPAERIAMRRAAEDSAARYDVTHFVEAWRRYYRTLLNSEK